MLLLTILACNKTTSNPTTEEPSASEQIGSQGGTITTPDGVFSLEIPAGALSESVTITVTGVPNDGPLGMSWELGPDGLEFATPAIATLSMAIEDTTLLEADGFYGVPSFLSISDGTQEDLNVLEISFEDGFVATAEVEHFSEFRVAAPGYYVRGIFFPAKTDGRFSLKTGERGTSAMQVKKAGPLVPGVATPVQVDHERSLVLGGELTMQDPGTDPGISLIQPEFIYTGFQRVVQCTGLTEDTASIIHQASLPLSPQVNTILSVINSGTCGGSPPDPTVIEDIDLLFPDFSGLGNLAIAQGELVAIRSTGVETVSATLGSATAAVELEGGSIIAVVPSNGSDQLYLQSPGGAPTLAYAGAKISLIDKGDKGGLYIVIEDGDTVLFGEVVESNGTPVLAAVDDLGLSEQFILGLRVATDDRVGSVALDVERGVIYTDPDGVQTELYDSATQLICDGGALCIANGPDGTRAGLWQQAAEPPALEDFEDQAQAEIGPIGEYGDTLAWPAIEGEDLVTRIWNGGVVLTTSTPLAGCEAPTNPVMSADGGRKVRCGKDIFAVNPPELKPEPVCQDVWEHAEPETAGFAYYGFPHSVGAGDTDRFEFPFDVPATCEDGQVVVTIETRSDAVRIDGEDLLYVDVDDTYSLVESYDVLPASQITIIGEITAGDECVNYTIGASLHCKPAPDESEDDDSLDDPYELGDGEEMDFVGGTLNVADDDYRAFTTTAPACEGTATVTTDRKDLSLNSLTVTAHADGGFTTLGTASGGTPGSQTLNFTTLAAGRHILQMSSPYASHDSYDLSFDLDCPFACETDAYEPNDTQDTAWKLCDSCSPESGPWTRTHTVSPDNEDWFVNYDVTQFSSIRGPYDWTIDVEILDGDPDAVLTLELMDNEGRVAVTVEDVLDGETVIALDAMPYGLWQADYYARWTTSGGCLQIEATYSFVE